VPLAMLQSYAMLTLFQSQGAISHLSPLLMLTSMITITAGCLLLMWLGELITEKGIGNGVSLLILAGIIARVPESIREVIFSWDPSQLPAYLLFFAMAVLIVAGVVMVNEARRNIPVSYAKRVRGMKMYGGVSTYLPLNVNPAGVIPIIFALSIMLFPGMIANFLSNSGGTVGNIARTVGNLFENQWIYGAIYFVLVILFTYFYTSVTFDPKAISQNLQKMGGFIPGIRPGSSTTAYLFYILNRILLIGALFLGTVAVLPSVISGATGIAGFTFLIGGTSLLITVSVIS
jgi:preprotein translocase subunit SecY